KSDTLTILFKHELHDWIHELSRNFFNLHRSLEKVEAMKCLGPCEFYNCKVDCKKRGYLAGECVGWNQPDMCCCIPKLHN
ncbi:hypothetical protein HID58_003738, partial [Brassica napus]